MQPLTNRSIMVSDKKMTFLEWIYIPAIVKGMSITLRHFFGKKATISYPEQKREFSILQFAKSAIAKTLSTKMKYKTKTEISSMNKHFLI